jgi:hypothetical protein
MAKKSKKEGPPHCERNNDTFTTADWVACWCTNPKTGKASLVTVDNVGRLCPLQSSARRGYFQIKK